MTDTPDNGPVTPELGFELPAMPPPGSVLLTPREAAERCRVSIRTMRRWLAAGELEGAFRTADGHWNIPPHALMGRLPRSKPAPEPTPVVAAPTSPPVGDAIVELRLELAIERERRAAAEQLADERGRRADELGQALERALGALEAHTRQLGAGTVPVVDAPVPVVDAPSGSAAEPTPVVNAPSGPGPSVRRRWWHR